MIEVAVNTILTKAWDNNSQALICLVHNIIF